MPSPTITKRPGRRHYYTFIDGGYVSTGQTDQRLAMQAATRIHAVGVEVFRHGKTELSTKLVDLIEEHLRYLAEHDHRNAEHIRKKRIHLGRPVEAGQLTVLRDVTKKSVESFLNALACGPKTRNEYQTSWNVFLDWLVYEDRLDENPIRDRIRRARVKPEDTTKRRAFTIDELVRLISVSSRRELLYLTASTTGARLGELEQLNWADVHESEEVPYIELRAETTKNRKGRTQVITSELASALATARRKARTTRVFRTIPSHHTINNDMAIAGIPKETEEGVACFHGLRHTFTTIVAKQTKDPRLAQRMADHADITTTQRYMHTERSEEAEVMRNFPQLRATERATRVVQTGQIVSIDGSPRPSKFASQVPWGASLSPDVSEQVVRSLEMEPGGIEPPCRNGRSGASTRVVDDLISTLHRPSTACFGSSSQSISRRFTPGSAGSRPACCR